MAETKRRRRRAVPYSIGDVFGIPLLNGRLGLGQYVADGGAFGEAVCALADTTVASSDPVTAFPLGRVVSLVPVTREALKFGDWPVLAHYPALDPGSFDVWKAWVAQKWLRVDVHNSLIVEDFMNAYHGLAPWDMYFDPEYFDRMLISETVKPDNLVYKG
jgi:hypothetical protein